MIRPRDIAIDSFEACLIELSTAYELAGLPREEIRGAIERRLRAFSGPTPPQPFDPSRPADGAEVYVDVKEDGHVF